MSDCEYEAEPPKVNCADNKNEDINICELFNCGLGHVEKTEDCKSSSTLPSLGCHDFSKGSYFWRDDEFYHSNIFSANTKDLDNTTNKGHTHNSDSDVYEKQPTQPLSESHKDSDERKYSKDSPPKSAKLFEMPS